MRIIKGTQDAKREKGVVQGGGRVLRCSCGGTAQEMKGQGARKFHCGKCGRSFQAKRM